MTETDPVRGSASVVWSTEGGEEVPEVLRQGQGHLHRCEAADPPELLNQ